MPQPTRSITMPKQSDRVPLVRAAFDAQVDLLFVTSRQKHAGDLSLAPGQVEGLRQDFRNFMEQRHWQEWQEWTAKDTDDELHRIIEDCHDQMNCLGLKEWQKQQRQS